MGRGLRRTGARPRDPRWLTQAWDLPRIFHDLGFPANQGQEWAPRAHVERHQVLTLVNCILSSASVVIDCPQRASISHICTTKVTRDGDLPTLWSFFPLVCDDAWQSPPTPCAQPLGLRGGYLSPGDRVSIALSSRLCLSTTSWCEVFLSSRQDQKSQKCPGS